MIKRAIYWLADRVGLEILEVDFTGHGGPRRRAILIARKQ